MIRATHWSGPGGHAENQDAFVVGAYWSDPTWWVAAVADGQGGQAGAAEAAQCGCRAFLDQAKLAPSRMLTSPANWLTWLRAVDEAVQRDKSAGYFALVALAVSDTALIGVSSGDCAAVAYCGGEKPVVLTDRQSKNPPVGSASAHFTPFALPLAPPWTVLLCSDGVWKYTGWEALYSLDPRQPGEEIVASLRRRAALPRTGELQDDFTMVLLQRET
jgi:PPM family protein phosphatase